MKKIEIETWNRKQTYQFFESYDVPRYLMSFDLDVTEFVNYVKQNKLSFYLSFMYLVMEQMNAIENFRYRIIKDEVYLFESTHPSYIDLIEDSEQIKFVTAHMEKDIFKFNESAKQKSEAQKDQMFIASEEARFDLVYVTTFPWAKYTQVSHAHMMDRKESIPKIAWSKFEKQNDRLILSFSLEVHHALIDGLHVGRLIQNIQEKLKSY